MHASGRPPQSALSQRAAQAGLGRRLGRDPKLARLSLAREEVLVEAVGLGDHLPRAGCARGARD
eukprot:2325469-Prymnesium_polylepis.1